MNLNDLKTLISKLNRVATTQALIALNREYVELSEFTVNSVKKSVETIFNENWVSDKRREYWQSALNVINRFWAEHYSKTDSAGRLSIAFPGIARLLLDPDMRYAWIATVLGCIGKADFGPCRIFETPSHGHRLVVTHKDVDYLVSPTGIEKVTENTELGSEISSDFYNGSMLGRCVSVGAYLTSVIEVDNYYYRTLALCVGLIDELDAPNANYEQVQYSLRSMRMRCIAMETLLIARSPAAKILYAASGLPFATGLLMSANMGEAKPVSNLLVRSAPLDIPNHQFIANHAVAELARVLKRRGIDLEENPYPELIAVVANLAVQVVKSTEPNSTPIVRFNEPLSLKFADLIYELERGFEHAVAFTTAAKEFKPQLADAAKILTVVYKNHIRC